MPQYWSQYEHKLRSFWCDYANKSFSPVVSADYGLACVIHDPFSIILLCLNGVFGFTLHTAHVPLFQVTLVFLLFNHTESKGHVQSMCSLYASDIYGEIC